MECVHTDLDGTDDMMVGLGLYTYYYSNVALYNYGSWWFSTQAGHGLTTTPTSTVSFMPPMGEIYELDFGLSTAYHSVSYDYSTGSWTNQFLYDGQLHNIVDDNNNLYYSYCVTDQHTLQLSRVSTAGMTQGAFYYNNNPSTVYYYYAQTQVPTGHSIPQGISPYNFLTAHNTGDW